MSVRDGGPKRETRERRRPQYVYVTSAATTSNSASLTSGGIPFGATMVVLQAETANVRYRDDGGAPTATIRLDPGQRSKPDALHRNDSRAPVHRAERVSAGRRRFLSMSDTCARSDNFGFGQDAALLLGERLGRKCSVSKRARARRCASGRDGGRSPGALLWLHQGAPGLPLTLSL
jgi:hypothetical protein